MPAEEQLSDDYVASLLAKDATASKSKYSMYGILPKRALYNAPKPNTRFLKNIIKETDSHNAALRAKEASESRTRMRELRNRNGTPDTLQSNDGRLSREDGPLTKRRRVENDEDAESDRGRDDRKRKSRGDRDPRSGTHRSHRKDRGEYYNEEDNETRSSHKHHRHHRHRDRRRRSVERSLERYERRSRDSIRHRSKRPTRSRSRRPDREHRSRRHRRRSTSPISETGQKSPPQKNRATNGHSTRKTSDEKSCDPEKRAPSPASDSDPLESIIGPPPPPPAPKIQARGRGTFASTSAMDSHFSSNYDPSIDVQPDPDLDDDWDMALEALRDRQKWKTQGAERLKAAGFTEEEVQKWEKGGEKREEDVRWKGRGESREWDRGKVVGEDGIETVPEWGRLKGT